METFPATPKSAYGYNKTVAFKTLISQFENGAEQRRKKWSQGKLTFTLIWNAITPTNMAILWNFYIARLGSYDAFTFVDPLTTSSYTVRFLDDSMSYEMFTYNLTRSGLKLIQVL
jgi:hypothetical protein